ncbi:MAG: SDR family oxidoreductase [Desulfobacterales bacterium]|nr:SDR family oxidoreductase [Desulfobacterales bacterium]
MDKRLDEKVAIVVGAGQTSGDTIGNGRAISLLFARHGARVLLVDRLLNSAEDTKKMIDKEGGTSTALEADITKEDDCRKIAETCVKTYGRIDILVYNVGIGNNDNDVPKLTAEAWDSIFNTNLKGLFLTCKHVLPVMKDQGCGAIVNISSIAAVCQSRTTAYKVSKAGVNALTHQMAVKNAKKGIRVNTIMPGLLNTPMAIEGITNALDIKKEDLIKLRDDSVPLKGGMGDAWDTANAALFLASDEARFITSVILPVDGGQSARIG